MSTQKKPTPAATNEEEVKRLTIDIPVSLHRLIKAQCAEGGTTIVDEVRVLLIDKYVKK